MSTIRAGGFEWDSTKAALNVKKHGVSFAEAMECFLDPCWRHRSPQPEEDVALPDDVSRTVHRARLCDNEHTCRTLHEL